MKAPGEDAVRMIGALVIVAAILFLGFMVRKSGKDAASFEGVKGKLDTTEQSADLGREAENQAAKIMQGQNNAARTDRKLADAARRPTASAVDHDRLQQRAREVYAEGLCAEKRLQREDCEPGVPAAAGK